jgi:hypothetical protein
MPSLSLIADISPTPEIVPAMVLAPIRLPLLLTPHAVEHLDATDARTTTVTIVLNRILAYRPVPHGGLND